MKAEELRIGNLVNYGKDIADSVVSINYNMVHLSQYSALSYDDIQPIPLTEEWIEKFGFEFQEDESPYGMMLYTNEDWTFCILEERGTYSYAESQGEDYEYFDVMCLRTVHQLQNLYFALTGEELTMNI